LGLSGAAVVTPAQAHKLLELLDRIDESLPSPGDVFVLKGVVKRLIAMLEETTE
jgi:hypothetical protein